VGPTTTSKHQIYFCNIQIKHLQHTSKTDENLGHIVKTPLQHVQHPDLLLKYPDATLATYKRRQIKHLRHASETLAIYMYKKQMKHWG
jgi:hypothetical protein